MNGKVFLIGAGPGDPGLLTVKGHKILEEADVVLYDALIGRELLDIPKQSCEKIYVGKRAGSHAMRQEEINERLVALAKRDLNVVRLKGGDPYLFGRGGEEAIACREAEVPFEVVPGVTSAFAVPAYAGIPVLQRQVAGSVLVIHGHMKKPKPAVSEQAVEEVSPTELKPDAPTAPVEEKPEEIQPRRGGIVIKRHRRGTVEDSGRFTLKGQNINEDPSASRFGFTAPDDDSLPAFHSDDSPEYEVDWDAVSRAADTLVILMGIGHMKQIRDGLLEAGKDAKTPVAVIQWGTTVKQHTHVSTLESFPESAEAAGVGSPGIIVVGEVVSLRDQLSVFENRPFFGWRVALTEDRHACQELADTLEESGAQVAVTPISSQPPLASTRAERDALQRSFTEATHIIFNRPSLIPLFLKSMRITGFDHHDLFQQATVIAVGIETGDALREAGIDGLSVAGDSIKSPDFRGAFGPNYRDSRVIVVESEDDWNELADDLEGAGAKVTSVPVYNQAPSRRGMEELSQLIEADDIDALIFPSSSSASVLFKNWGPQTLQRFESKMEYFGMDQETVRLFEKQSVPCRLLNPDEPHEAIQPRREHIGA